MYIVFELVNWEEGATWGGDVSGRGTLVSVKPLNKHQRQRNSSNTALLSHDNNTFFQCISVHRKSLCMHGLSNLFPWQMFWALSGWNTLFSSSSSSLLIQSTSLSIHRSPCISHSAPSHPWCSVLSFSLLVLLSYLVQGNIRPWCPDVSRSIARPNFIELFFVELLCVIVKDRYPHLVYPNSYTLNQQTCQNLGLTGHQSCKRIKNKETNLVAQICVLADA